MTTADEFKRARFATHPDGSIAARIDPDEAPWRTSSVPVWLSDEGMAADGWVPLDETRLPRVVTDEMVERAWEEWTTLDPDDVDSMRRAVTAALSAAPTTDDDAGIGPETRTAYRDLHTPTTDERKPLVRMSDWEEAIARAQEAEAALEDLREQYGTAVREKDEWEANAEKAEARAESYRVTVGRASAAETAERLRAEKAERERAEAVREAEELGEALDNVKPMDTLTAREHLDAARDARASGHPLPKGATIPAGVPFWVKAEGEPWEFAPGGPAGDFDTSPFAAAQYVLVDPPTPSRPAWADAPAVFAVADAYGRTLWRNEGDGTWRRGTNFVAPTSALEDVTPLYPEEGEER